MGTITKKEHFVPRLIIRRFAPEGTALAYHKKSRELIEVPAEEMFHKKYLYEFKNASGEFYEINQIEKTFSNFESNLGVVLKRIDDGDNFLTDEAIEIIANALILQMLRENHLKEMLEREGECFRDLLGEDYPLAQRASYRLFIAPKGTTQKYLIGNGWSHGLENFEEVGDLGLITPLGSLLRNTCSFSFIEAKGGSEFVLGDRPVAVKPDARFQYVFPVDTRHALGAEICHVSKRAGSFDRIGLQGDEVKTINKHLIDRADDVVLASVGYREEFEKLCRLVDDSA